MKACWYGHTATAELLIAKGADMEAKDMVRQLKGKGRTMPSFSST
jgi:ankyrin repeat protein